MACLKQKINCEFGITDGKVFYKNVCQVKKESKNPQAADYSPSKADPRDNLS